ncbi:MAG: hypothetical protein GEU74_16015 [Nitriliruptorales bacterium]|nr:hypothetical protein [Nitriliruptorales bacterium]
MTTHDVLVTGPAEPNESPHVQRLVDDFIRLQERNRGAELAAVLTQTVVLDLNVPQWRFQVGGDLAVAAAFAQSFPAGFRTTRSRWQPTPNGAVVEYDGWDAEANTYYRHLATLEIRDGRIDRLTIYCTGGWDSDTLERQRREAPMVDDEATGAAR